MIQELHILMGLPGAGKTHWAIEFKEEKNRGVCFPGHVFIMHCDKGLIQNFPERKYIVLDGIFTTIDDIKNGIQFVSRKYNVKKVLIHRWNDDIDSCIWNDKGRRDVSAIQTIKKLNIAQLKETDFADMNIPVEIEYHCVVRKPEYLQMYIPECALTDDKRYIRSAEWTVNGSWHSWNGSRGKYEKEEPVEFEAFDELLFNIDSRFPYLLYKKIWKECVTIEEETHSDYYSYNTVNYYQCDIEKLYKKLKEYNIL